MINQDHWEWLAIDPFQVVYLQLVDMHSYFLIFYRFVYHGMKIIIKPPLERILLVQFFLLHPRSKFKMTVSHKRAYYPQITKHFGTVPKMEESSPLYKFSMATAYVRVFPPPKIAFLGDPRLLSISTSRILSIVFNPNGTRCVTTDNNGVVGVWKTDQRGLCNQSLWQEKSTWERNRKQSTSPKTNSLSLDKLAVGKLLSSLGRSIFRGCVGFRECKGWSINPV